MSRSGRRGDIAITTVFMIVLALISIFMLLSLFAVKIPFFSKELYCSTFFHIQKATFMPQGVRVDEGYCRDQSALSKLTITNSTLVVNATSAAAVGCWQISEQGLRNKPVLCTSLTVRIREDLAFNYTNVTEVLASEGLGDFFNYTTNLSVANITINSSKEGTILVEYDNNTKMVRVS